MFSPSPISAHQLGDWAPNSPLPGAIVNTASVVLAVVDPSLAGNCEGLYWRHVEPGAEGKN